MHPCAIVVEFQVITARFLRGGEKGAVWSPGKRLTPLVGVAVVGILLLGFTGLSVDFYAADPWITASWWITGIGGLPLGFWLAFKGWPQMEPTLRMWLGTFIGVPIVVALMWGSVVTRALPYLYTRMAGTPFTIAQEVTKATGVRGCSRIVRGRFFESGGLDRHYCAGSAEFSALPTRGDVIVRGRESWFGRQIDQLEPLPQSAEEARD